MYIIHNDLIFIDIKKTFLLVSNIYLVLISNGIKTLVWSIKATKITKFIERNLQEVLNSNEIKVSLSLET